MLTTATRLRIQDILRRVAQGQSVSLQDRIYVNKFAEHDRTVNSWVNRARRIQLQQAPSKGLDGFLADVDQIETGHEKKRPCGAAVVGRG